MTAPDGPDQLGEIVEDKPQAAVSCTCEDLVE